MALLLVVACRACAPLAELERVAAERLHRLESAIPLEVEFEKKIIHLLRVTRSKIIYFYFYLLLLLPTSTCFYLLLPT